MDHIANAGYSGNPKRNLGILANKGEHFPCEFYGIRTIQYCGNSCSSRCRGQCDLPSTPSYQALINFITRRVIVCPAHDLPLCLETMSVERL